MNFYLFMTDPTDKFIYVRDVELEDLMYSCSSNFPKEGKLTVSNNNYIYLDVFQ